MGADRNLGPMRGSDKELASSVKQDRSSFARCLQKMFRQCFIHFDGTTGAFLKNESSFYGWKIKQNGFQMEVEVMPSVQFEDINKEGSLLLICIIDEGDLCHVNRLTLKVIPEMPVPKAERHLFKNRSPWQQLLSSDDFSLRAKT